MIERAAPKSYRYTMILFVTLVIGFWAISRDARVSWPGVPPIPQENLVSFSSLGDEQLAYRSYGMTIQNLGDTGGRVIPLEDYDYERLGGWFHMLNGLDNRSDFIPMLAAYYFGAVRVPEKLPPMVDFLAVAGSDARGVKWRWLVQAIYLARFRMNDIDRALELSYKLSDLHSLNGDMPIWTKQMPAYVLAAKGEKEAAIELMKVILGSTDNLHPNEINHMKAYIEGDL